MLALCAVITLTISIIVSPFCITAEAATGKTIDIVTVEGGLIKGVNTDVDGIQLFKGVPFAGFTGGDNRWKKPQSLESWQGIKLQDTWGDQVMQNASLNPVGTFYGDEFYFDDSFTPAASENGLNLNVYTPAKTTDDKLPVLVFIHGGGNDHGHASEMELYASQLAEKGIVVVTVQYRVGVFGFLALPELSAESEYGVSGNYALLDLIKSLEWVNKNIGSFGGNSNQVTLAGQSAGAHNVIALLRTPLAKGLFHRVIIQSSFQNLLELPKEGASVYKPLAEKEIADEALITKLFGKKMSLKELRALPAEYFFTTKTPDATQTLYDALTKSVKGYSLDGYVFTEESVDLTREGALDGIDIIIGGAADDRTTFFSESATMSMAEFEAMMKKTYGDDYTKAYNPSSSSEAYNLYVRSQSDIRFQPYLLSAQYAKAHNKNLNVYTYYFDHAPSGRNSEFYGAFHSSDLWYFFSSIRNTNGQRSWTDSDYAMANIMSSYYANFVKNGNPNAADLPEWKETTTRGTFARFYNGKAETVTATPFPLRDELNRKTAMKNIGITDADLMETATAPASIINVKFDGDVPKVEGEILVPLRDIFEAVSAKVTWDSSTKTVYAVKGTQKIELIINQKLAKVNGITTALSQPGQQIKGKTMVPLQFVSDSLGIDISWNEGTKTFTISNN